MKEFKVGDRFILEAVEQDDCDGCFFLNDDTCHNPTRNDWADGFHCQSENRSDHKNVIFKKVKE